MPAGTRTVSSIAWSDKPCRMPRPNHLFRCPMLPDTAAASVNFPKGVDTTNRLTPILIGTRERGATAYRRCPSFFLLVFLRSHPATSRRSQFLRLRPAEARSVYWSIQGQLWGLSRRSGVPVPGSTRVTRGERPGRRQTFTNPAASRRRKASVTA